MDNLITMGAGIPMYAHPNTDSGDWATLSVDHAPVDWIVLNQDNGPGASEDVDLYNAAREIRDIGTRVLGYIPLNYGARDDFFNNADAETYSTRGIKSSFLDQCPADAPNFADTALTILRQRQKGMEFVVINPGVVPVREYCDIADQVVTFEGDPAMYRAATFPSWTREYPADRFVHLLHGVTDADVCAEMITLARNRNCNTVFCHSTIYDPETNTWDGLPSYWAQQARLLRSRPRR